MTAEIAVLNSEGVALASDSAVTSETEITQKVSTTSNKIFALSNNRPVGIMIYGNARYLAYPWETIIKLYRTRVLPLNGYSTLEEYAKDFINYLNSTSLPIHDFTEDNYIGSFVESFLLTLYKTSIEKVEARIKQGESFDNSLLHECLNDDIRQLYDEYSNGEIVVPLVQSKNVMSRYKEGIYGNIEVILGEGVLNSQEKNGLMKIITNAFSRTFLDDLWTGVVVAGFGEDELLPTVRSYQVEGRFQYKTKKHDVPVLKYSFDQEKSFTANAYAGVIPFAQEDMVHRFMTGVDPYYRYAEEGMLHSACNEFVDTIVGQLDRYNDQEKVSLKQQLSTHTENLLNEVRENMSDFVSDYFVNPVTEAVSRLTKDELATMAEALVHLTSVKKKMSDEPDTVGGPIDVAVITKGDGFIWIKRKHYFNPAANIRYFLRALKEMTYDQN